MGRFSLKQGLWNLAVFGWVAAPIFGFSKGLHPVQAQYGWWIIQSIVVLGLSTWVKKDREIHVIEWLYGAFVCVWLVHFNSLGVGLAWILKATPILLAAIAIGQRTSGQFLIQCLFLCTLVQIPIIVFRLFGLEIPWSQAGGGMAGSLYRRSALSSLAGLVSIWLEGWNSFWMCLLSLWSGSFTGFVPSVLCLLSKSVKHGRTAVLAAVGVLGLMFPIWGLRFLPRIEAWKGLEFLKDGWLTGWGFFPMPGGFQEDAFMGKAIGNVVLANYHSVWLDWIGRFGLIGIGVMSPLVVWMIGKSLERRSYWKVWTLWAGFFIGSLQSAEAVPVLSLLGLIWMIRLNEEEDRKCGFAISSGT